MSIEQKSSFSRTKLSSWSTQSGWQSSENLNAFERAVNNERISNIENVFVSNFNNSLSSVKERASNFVKQAPSSIEIPNEEEIVRSLFSSTAKVTFFSGLLSKTLASIPSLKTLLLIGLGLFGGLSLSVLMPGIGNDISQEFSRSHQITNVDKTSTLQSIMDHEESADIDVIHTLASISEKDSDNNEREAEQHNHKESFEAGLPNMEIQGELSRSKTTKAAHKLNSRQVEKNTRTSHKRNLKSAAIKGTTIPKIKLVSDPALSNLRDIESVQVESTQDSVIGSHERIKSGNTPGVLSATLAHELSLYEEAYQAEKDGRLLSAKELYHEYIREFPTGRMIAAAHFGLINIASRRQEFDEVIKQSNRYLKRFKFNTAGVKRLRAIAEEQSPI